MSGNELSLFVALISDVMERFGIPVSTAKQLYDDIIQKRKEEALEIMLSELRDGQFVDLDENEIVSVVARYQRCAVEGAAKTNLRLLARLIKGMADKRALRADNFMRYADILSGLSHEELVVISIMANLNWGLVAGDRGKAKFLKAGIKDPEAVQQALIRTGLVRMQLRKSDPRFEGASLAQEDVPLNQIYTLTPLMTEIEQYIETMELS